MSNQRSVGQFCSITVGTINGAVNSVATINGPILGEGAECFCIQNGKSYRYTATTISGAAPCYVAASGGGTWVEQGAITDFSFGILGAVGFQSATQNNPSAVNLALPSSAGFYVTSLAGSLWSLNGTTGVVTYTGPTGLIFNVTQTLAYSTTASDFLVLDLTANGARIGTTTRSTVSVLSATDSTQLATSATQSTILTPVNGATYQTIWLGTGGATYAWYSYALNFIYMP